MQLYGDGSPIYVASLTSGVVFVYVLGSATLTPHIQPFDMVLDTSDVFGLGFNIGKLYLNGRFPSTVRVSTLDTGFT